MEVIKYDLNTAAIARMADIYLNLKIDGIDDEAGATEVHAAKMIVVKHRTNINRLRLSSNKDAQNFIKKNNKDASILIDALAPIETHLKEQENVVIAEKERIQTAKEAAEKAKIEERVAALFAVNVNVPYFDIAMLSDAEFKTMFDEATNKHMLEHLRLQEEERAREEEAAKLKIERANQKAEAKRLSKIQAEQEAAAELVRIEQEAKAKAIADKEAAIEAKQKAFEEEKKKEQERKNKEKFERKAQIEATRKARYESLKLLDHIYPLNDLGRISDKSYSALYEIHKKVWDEKQKKIFLDRVETQRVEKERVEKENAAIETQKRREKEAFEKAEKARVEALLPIKNRIHNYVDGLLKEPLPTFDDIKATELIQWAFSELKDLSARIKVKADDL